MREPPDLFVFMKVGMHAGEAWNDILSRKHREYRETGHTFWGYGGSACHPLTQVQPFARQAVERGGRVHLLMQTMDSRADPDLLPATEYSEDGVHWKELPSGIHVTGSRYAIVLGEISETEFELPLHDYAVALGRSQGRSASDYVRARIDKACLSLARGGDSSIPHISEQTVKITHTAEIKSPFAVLLRGVK